MINILNYNLNSDYESNKESLEQLDNYVAFTEDNQMVHLKPLNIFYVTTYYTGTTIYKLTADGYETIKLEKGENKLTDWNYGFYFLHNMGQEQITSFDVSKYDTSKVTNMYHMFYNCSKLTSLDVSKFDTSKVTDMSVMFSYCSGLTSLDLSSFDTTNVTDMSNMFHLCTGLTSLDLSNFDTSNVTNMYYMFGGCTKLTHIKCKQAFKDWCITNKTEINLPTAMRNGTVGTDSSYNWEIIDLQS